MARKTAVRFVPASVLLAAALVGPGCSVDFDGLSGSVICTIDCGGERPPVGSIRMSLQEASVEVGQTIQVTAALSGPIVHFSILEWRVSDRAVIAVRPVVCSSAADERRTCTAEVTGLAPGRARVSVMADRDPGVFNPLYGWTEIVVVK